ncbi:MAG: hypothetical protein HQ446_00580 [Polaromonas sp.]|nr:hypothetical protein [Polaromonas sp.]
MISRQQLYAMGEPLGESATRAKPGGRIYGGGGSGGGGSSTTVQSIPDELKPLASAYTNKAINLGNQAYQPYGGQRYEDLNATQNLGIGMTQNRALYGDPTMNQANQTMQQTLRGGNTNPYLDSMVAKAQGSVMGNMGALQARSGSFGNSGIAEQGAQQMGKIATDMYGGAYAGDRANQMQALGMAPQYGNQAYQDAGQLMKVGQMQQDQNQQNRDFNYGQFQDANNLPYKQLQAMSGVFGSNLGSTSTTQSGGGGK